MTMSFPARARRGIRGRGVLRTAALAAAVALGLGLGLAGVGVGGGSAAATPATATPAAPAATTADAAVMLTVAPSANGVVTADSGLSITVRARNTTTATVPAGAVRLQASRTPLTTRADLQAWLAGTAVDAGRTELALADTTLDAIAGGADRVAAVSVDPAPLLALAPGVYPLRAEFDGPQGALSATSVLVVPGAAATGSLGVVVPITAPESTGGLLGSDRLAELTATGGSLRASLDAVAGTSAILAVDPAVVAAIRVLGTSAPASAVRWLDDLLALPNARFALQFGDADLATQVTAGLTAPLAVSTLAPYESADDFNTAPSPGPNPSATPAATPSPSPSGTPGGTPGTLPTLEQLTDIGANSTPALWPATGTAGSEVVTALAASGTVTLVDSGALADPASPVRTRVSAAGASVLVYDVDASAALRTAATGEAPVDRAGGLAAASAYAALADPAAPLLVAVDRSTSFEGGALRDAVRAATALGGRPAADLATLAAAAPADATLRSVEADQPRADRLRSLLDDEATLTSFASILADPAVLTAPERASILQLLGNAWRDTSAQTQTDAFDAHRAQTQQTLQSVAIAPPSDITLAATSAPLTFSVRNDLPWEVSVVLIATPSDPRLLVQTATTVAAEPAQNTRVQVPAQARVGSGESNLTLQLYSASGVAIGDTVPVHVAVRAEWESIGVIVMGAGILGLIVFGVVRTVRKNRRARRRPQPADGAPGSATGTTDAAADGAEDLADG